MVSKRHMGLVMNVLHQNVKRQRHVSHIETAQVNAQVTCTLKPESELRGNPPSTGDDAAETS